MSFGDVGADDDGIDAGGDGASSSPSIGDSVYCRQTLSVATYHKTCTDSLCGGTYENKKWVVVLYHNI